VGALIGAVLALKQFLRAPSPQWFVLLGFSFLVALALIHRYIEVPYVCMVKAFYGMSALVPFCAITALGLDFLSSRAGKGRMGLVVAFGVWTLSSYGSFWILRSASATVVAQAKSLRDEGRLADARRLLERQLEHHAEDREVRSSLVTILIDANENEKAMEQAQTLLAQNPNNAAGHVNLATLLARQGQLDEAVSHCRRATELAPGYRPAWQQLATILIAAGAYEKAEQAAREGLAVAPFNSDVRRVLAEAQLKKGIPQERDRATAYSNLGARLFQQGKVDEAIANFREAVKLKPDFAGAHCNLGAALATKGQFDEAIVEFQEALRLKPDYKEAKDNLSRAMAAKH
jgi:tetratricopeptide (TPR) repeat protein